MVLYYSQYIFLVSQIIILINLIVSIIAYDYVTFCLRTCYSRLIFFVLPSKLQRLKKEREEIGNEIKIFIDNYVKPDYKFNNDIMVDVSKDDLQYLDGLFTRRDSRLELMSDLNGIDIDF